MNFHLKDCLTALHRLADKGDAWSTPLAKSAIDDYLHASSPGKDRADVLRLLRDELDHFQPLTDEASIALVNYARIYVDQAIGRQ